MPPTTPFVFPADKLSPGMPVVLYIKGTPKPIAGWILHVKTGCLTARLWDEDGRQRNYSFCYHKDDPYWKMHQVNLQYPDHAMFDFTNDWKQLQQIYAEFPVLKSENAKLQTELAEIKAELVGMKENRASERNAKQEKSVKQVISGPLEPSFAK